MDYTIYVFGNGDFMYSILVSVAFFMSHAKSFFTLAGLIGLAYFALESSGVAPSRGYDWMRFIRMYIIIAIFVSTPFPKPVNVYDVITDDNRVVNLQNNRLPFGLVVPFVFVSKITYNLIMMYQQNFEIDSNLSYSYSGMNFGANFIQSLDNAASYDKNFDYDLDQYFQNCGFPLLYKQGLLSTLTSSPDIIKTLKDNTSDARWVQQINLETSTHERTILSCKDAIEAISRYYTNHSDEILKHNVQMMGVSTGSGYERFISSAETTAMALMNISMGASQAMKQAIAMNMIMTSIKDGAHAVGNGNLALAAYDAEQFQQYKTTSMMNGASAARTVPILVATALAVLMFLYPIMIFLAVIAGSYRAVGTFFQILMAVYLMPLIFEILNYITTFYLQKKLGIVLQGSGYSYDISTTLYSFTDNMITASNYLVASTPIIAYAIVSGSSMALTSVFGHLNDPAKSQSAKVGEEYSHGNQNIGNTTMDTHSYNNIQSNKLDDQVTTNSGVPIQREYTPTGMVTNQGGEMYYSQAKSDLDTNIDLSRTRSHMLSNAQDSNIRTMSNIGKQWNNQNQTLASLMKAANNHDSWGDNLSVADRDSLSNAYSLTSNLSGGAVWNGNGITFSGQASDQRAKSLESLRNLSHNMSNSKDETIRNEGTKLASLVDNSSYAIEQSANISRALNDSESTQTGIHTNYGKQFTDWMSDQGINPLDQNISPTQRARLAEQFVVDNLASEWGVDKKLLNPLNPSDITNPTKGHHVDPNNVKQPTVGDGGTSIQDAYYNTSATQAQQAYQQENNPAGTLKKQAKQHIKVGKKVGKAAQNKAETIVGKHPVKPPVKTY